MEKEKRQTIYSNQPGLQSNNAGNKAPATIWINVRGTRIQGDLDGKIATVLDCLVEEKIIYDDSVRYINSIYATFNKSEEPGIDIIIIED